MGAKKIRHTCAGHRPTEQTGMPYRNRKEDPLSSSNSEPGREVEALRERIAALSAAILRISASLDVDTVLREIAEAARGLTGARYAVITTIDGARELEHTVLSGLTPETRRQLEQWSDGLRAFEALRDVPSPLRVADMPA